MCNVSMERHIGSGATMKLNGVICIMAELVVQWYGKILRLMLVCVVTCDMW
jgi:hypothetical protein